MIDPHGIVLQLENKLRTENSPKPVKKIVSNKKKKKRSSFGAFDFKMAQLPPGDRD